MAWLNNAMSILFALQAVFVIGFVIIEACRKDTECATCRQRRLWKEGWDADTVLRNDPRF